MNMPTTLAPGMQSAPPPPDEVGLGAYVDVVMHHKWLVALCTAIGLALGVSYALFARPVYEANLLVQVEDTDPNTTKSFLREASAFFDVKTLATAEIEILRSRAVVGKAVDAVQLYVDARPNYAPLVGNWMARRATGLSDPGFLGMGGYVSGTERIRVAQFDVPPDVESEPFTLTAQGDGAYTLKRDGWSEAIDGRVDELLKADTPDGPISLMVTQLDGKVGAEFELERHSRLRIIENLQASLALSEQGKQSGVINVGLRDANPERVAQVLNEVGAQYVRQNLERKAAEAQKTLGFLNDQLPQFKRQLEDSEAVYNQFRNQRGTIALEEEARLILETAVERQTELLTAQQKRRELAARYTDAHPTMQSLNQQITALTREIGGIQGRIKDLPGLQQDVVRMERDVKVNNELYQSLLNQALQLQLIKEGRLGNVRLLDEAVTPEKPVMPKRAASVALGLMAGLLFGLIAAFVRHAFSEQRIRDPQELELESGLPLFATIPASEGQYRIGQRKMSGVHTRLLAIEHPEDPAVESLRSLRTAMQFAMLEAPDNRVMIAGPTPGLGKSFVAANFAALMAASGKRTLLIDADLRRGHQHQYFGLQRHGGLSELIAGSLTPAQTIHRNVVTNLDFLATGQLPPNPAELLVSESFAKSLEQLSADYELVIIDGPPVLVASDAATVARHVGTVLMVARTGTSSLGEVREAQRRLSLSGRAVTGLLVNGMESKRRTYGNYKYGRYSYTNYDYESVMPEENAQNNAPRT